MTVGTENSGQRRPAIVPAPLPAPPAVFGSNWSRQTGDQIKELRRQLQKLKDRSGEEGADGASPDLAKAIGNSIGDALGKSGDLKTVRTLQTAMAFALAMVYPIVIYLLFKLAE